MHGPHQVCLDQPTHDGRLERRTIYRFVDSGVENGEINLATVALDGIQDMCRSCCIGYIENERHDFARTVPRRHDECVQIRARSRARRHDPAVTHKAQRNGAANAFSRTRHPGNATCRPGPSCRNRHVRRAAIHTPAAAAAPVSAEPQAMSMIVTLRDQPRNVAALVRSYVP